MTFRLTLNQFLHAPPILIAEFLRAEGLHERLGKLLAKSDFLLFDLSGLSACTVPPYESRSDNRIVCSVRPCW